MMAKREETMAVAMNGYATIEKGRFVSMDDVKTTTLKENKI